MIKQNNQLRHRFEGLLLGAAVGDALGMPTEYISKEELERAYGGRVKDFKKASPGHPCSHLKAGQYTDDTQQLILLAESLIEKRRFDVYDFGRKIGDWANKCTHIPDYNRFGGGTSLSAGMKIYNGESPLKAGVSRATCGSTMRVGPLGLFYHNNVSELKEAATLASKVTHNHPAAIDSSVFISYLVAHLVNDNNVEDAVQKSRAVLTSDQDLAKRIDYVIAHQGSAPSEVAAIIGTSESAYETVPMALHCFLHSPSDYEKTIVEAANLVPGDTDSIACIAGALSGVYNGADAIPKKFRMNIEDSAWLNYLGRLLFEVTQNIQKPQVL